jgi:hypothetical protein
MYEIYLENVSSIERKRMNIQNLSAATAALWEIQQLTGDAVGSRLKC